MQGDLADHGVDSPLDPSTGISGLPAAAMTAPSRPQTAAAGATAGPVPSLLLQELPQLDLPARCHLAQRLAKRADLPKPVAMALALDKIAVAHPVLRHSPSLEEAELIRIVEDASSQHHLVIAERSRLSPSVTAFLVEMSETEVMVQLLRNPGAMFTEYVFRRLVAASRHAAALRDPVLGRRELTLEMAQDLSRWVSAEQRRRIAERFGPEAVLALADPAAFLEPHPSPRLPDPATAPASAPARPRSHAHPLVAAIRDNDLGKLETTMAEMSGLPRFAVTRILTDPGAESLAVFCRGLALKRRLFTALYALLHQGRTRSTDMAAETFRGALAYFNRLRSPQAAGILQGWRKAPITVWHSKNSWTGRTWIGCGDKAA